MTWSDGKLFELRYPLNRQIGHVWAASSSNVPAVAGVKHPAKIQTWSMFSCCVIFKLFMTTQKTTISDEYYRRNILASDWLEPLNQTAQDGSVSERAYRCLIQAAQSSYGAAHHLQVPSRMRTDAERTFLFFWAKGLWLGNSSHAIPSIYYGLLSIRR